MATVIHRRIVRTSPATPTTPAEPRGPFASLAALSSLTVIGWLSLLAAVAWLVRGLLPLLEPGALDASRWGDDALFVVRTLGDAAPLALPAALELGVPGARRRTPWLMRGVLLLALADLARPAIGIVQELVVTAVDPTSQALDYESPIGIAFGMVTVASGLLTIGGFWALSDGLWDAGARPRRAILAAVALAGMIGTLAAYFQYLGTDLDLTKVIGWLNLASIAMSLAMIALALVVATRLVVGFPAGLVPRHAWALAAVAGAGLIVERFGVVVALGTGLQGPALSVALMIAGAGAWVVLAVALALGLGRGTERRTRRPPRLHLYVLYPTA